jgi:hypothetical protein
LRFHKDGELVSGETFLCEDVPLIVAIGSSRIGLSWFLGHSRGNNQRRADKQSFENQKATLRRQ